MRNPIFETNQGLSALAVELLDRLVSESQPVRISDGLRALFWTSSTLTSSDGSTTRYVAVSNNAEAAWEGTLETRMPSRCDKVVCEDVRQNRMLKPCSVDHASSDLKEEYSNVKVTTSITSHEVQVLKIVCQDN